MNAAFRGLRGAFRSPPIHLDAPQSRPPDVADEPLVRRIQAAFQRMKTDEASAPSWTKPALVWQKQLDTAYASLRDGVDAFHYFLANFAQWPQYTGIEQGGYEIQRFRRNWLARKYIEEASFRTPVRVWSIFHPHEPLSRLSLPRFGNQAGASYDGHFVSVGAPFDYITGRQLRQLVDDEPRPVVAELGAGYGKLAYCMLCDLPSFCYVDFDLPETTCTAAYYLSKCFPNRRVLLYGESEFSEASLLDFDLIFMPPWEIQRLGDRSVECFFNKNSLGEMRADAVHAYIGHIARTTRRHFFHMNHDRRRCEFGDGTTGLLGSEYPMPPNFRLVFRYPELGHFLWLIDQQIDIFQYLWTRRHE